MTEKKITKKEQFAIIRTIVEQSEAPNKAEMAAFIDHEIELLNRKSSSKSETKAQKENKVLKETVFDILEDMGKAVTVGEVAKVADLSSSKVTHLFKLLMEEGRVTNIKDKKTSLYMVANAEDGE